jgi:hypothetical protein
MALPVRARLCAVLVAVAASTHTVGAQGRGLKEPLAALPGSTLTIRGSTTLGAHWSCTATDIAAVAGLDEGATAFTAEAVRTVSVNVLVYALRCQSAAMERAMHKAMRAESDSSSAIVGHFASHLTRNGREPGGAHLDGTLIVAGVQRAVVFDVVGEQLSDRVFRVQCSVPLALSEFKISPPGTLFGRIRARDSIAVEVDMRFARPKPGEVTAFGAAHSRRQVVARRD